MITGILVKKKRKTHNVPMQSMFTMKGAIAWTVSVLLKNEKVHQLNNGTCKCGHLKIRTPTLSTHLVMVPNVDNVGVLIFKCPHLQVPLFN